jgi:peroxiredoxin
VFSVQQKDIAELGTKFVGWDGKETILLEPNKWKDKILPVLVYLNNDTDTTSEQLMQGRWILLFYKHDCEKCQRVILEYNNLSKELDWVNSNIKIALLALTTDGQQSAPYVSNKHYSHFSLNRLV